MLSSSNSSVKESIGFSRSVSDLVVAVLVVIVQF
jgi:hypothetical protein